MHTSDQRAGDAHADQEDYATADQAHALTLLARSHLVTGGIPKCALGRNGL